MGVLHVLLVAMHLLMLLQSSSIVLSSYGFILSWLNNDNVCRLCHAIVYDKSRVILNLSSVLQAVTLHTDLGDIKIELFCMQAPLACEVSQFASL